MTHEQYYIAPPEKVFDEIKKGAMEIWKTYDDTYGYSSDKINRIKDLQNIRDNAWFIVAMFDHQNQMKLISKVSPETAAMILDSMSPV